ncbi:MFS transporter [Deinococcus humi]|uniref:DHA1 family inner membrane transport protein n=1 Tax=Deinococcus humi TaxID=662880 RepID=A0A7W8K101_9DEIO|nr:MFS transporter [Deinococcus humi]MBB5365244.1 DHA1 family inner membrane transport protein [Deinococcus humi]GGO35733.1 MFS transporter [Deinococcus humi]
MQRSVTKSPDDRQQRPLLALAFAFFSVGLASLSVVGLGRAISAELHIMASQTALLVAAFAVIYALAALLVQSVFGHWSRRRLLITGLGILSVGLLLSAGAGSFALLMVARAVTAVGGAMVGPVASATGSLLVRPERQGQALATVFGGFTVASVLGAPLASVLAPTIGWRGVFLALAGVGLLGALLITRHLPPVVSGQRVTLNTYRQGLSIRGVRSTLLVTLLQMAALFSVYAVAGSYLGGRFGSSAGWISVTLLGFGLGGIVGNALSSRAVTRFGSHNTLLFTLLASAALVASLLIAPTVPWLGLAVFFLWSACANMFQAPQQARLINLHPAERGLMLALNASILYLGISVGSWLGSGLLPHLGVHHLVWPALLLLLLAAVIGHHGSRSASPATPALQ